VGEGCHFVDLLRYLAGAPITAAYCLRRDADGQDGGCFRLEFGNGSMGMFDYRTDLPAHVPKEIITVSGSGFTAQIYNWTRVTASGVPGAIASTGWWSEPRKGHHEAVRAFLEAIRAGGTSPIPLPEILEVSCWAVRLQALGAGEEARAAAN
jgi:predicted dehydrogenase